MINIVRGDPFQLTQESYRTGAWIISPDSLALGPSDIDPELHKQKRVSFFEQFHAALGFEGAIETTPVKNSNFVTNVVNSSDLLQVITSDLTETDMIRVWCTDAWQDQLFLLWVLDALRQFDHPSLKILYCELPKFGNSLDADEIAEHAPVLNAADISFANEFWEAFVADRPDRVFEMCQSKISTVELFKLHNLPLDYSSLFPRVEEGGLKLSYYDSALLGVLTRDRWQTVRNFISSLIPKMDRLGDLELSYRLFQWAVDSSDDPVILRQEIPEGVSYATRAAYRLTEKGKSHFKSWTWGI